MLTLQNEQLLEQPPEFAPKWNGEDEVDLEEEEAEGRKRRNSAVNFDPIQAYKVGILINPTLY